MPFNVDHLTLESDPVCVQSKSVSIQDSYKNVRLEPIGDATLQGWEVGTQNRVNDAKKESRPQFVHRLFVDFCSRRARMFFLLLPLFLTSFFFVVFPPHVRRGINTTSGFVLFFVLSLSI